MTTPAWFLDEVAHAGRENLDPVHAAGYDQKEDAGAAAEVEFLLRAGLTAESTVVEFGPGTGQLTVALAPHCRSVTAVDVSPVMRDQLQIKITELGLDNVVVVDGGFLSYVHPGPAADVVYSRFALHHLPDFWKVVALERIRAVLRPGGLFRLVDVVFSFDAGETTERIEAWRSAYGDATEAAWGRTDIDEHVRDEHSTFTWLLEPMLERAGFRIERADYDAAGFTAAYLLRTSLE